MNCVKFLEHFGHGIRSSCLDLIVVHRTLDTRKCCSADTWWMWI